MTDTTTTTAASDAPSVLTATVTTSTSVKSGWMTTEFYLGLFTKLLGGAYATGLIGEGTTAARIAGLAVVVLAYLGYTVSRAMVKTAAVLLLIGTLGSTLPACGASQRETTIKTALVTVDTARDSFVAFDASEQSMIVNKATSLDDGKAQLATYRDRRVKIVEAFTVAYRAIAAAATINDDPSIAGLSAALAQLLAAVTTITGGTP